MQLKFDKVLLPIGMKNIELSLCYIEKFETSYYITNNILKK